MMMTVQTDLRVEPQAVDANFRIGRSSNQTRLRGIDVKRPNLLPMSNAAQPNTGL